MSSKTHVRMPVVCLVGDGVKMAILFALFTAGSTVLKMGGELLAKATTSTSIQSKIEKMVSM